MHIFVGSTNPVKINAATSAAIEHWPDVVIEGIKVGTGVDAQPRTDEETKQGAINRAKAVLTKGLEKQSIEGEVLGMGLEGGIEDLGKEMWTTVWAAVVDREGNLALAAGSRFLVPPVIAERIRAGEEMGLVAADVMKETDPNRIRTNEGLVGIVTGGFIDRTEEYANIAKLALGMWYGRQNRQEQGLE